MAQDISLPVRFQCQIPRVSWQRANARPSKWVYEPATNEWEIGLEIKSYPSLRHSFSVESLPDEIKGVLSAPGERLGIAASGSSFEVLIGDFPARAIRPQAFDQWDVRERVVSLKHNVESLLELLHRFGIWSTNHSPYLDDESGEYEPVIVIPGDVFREQVQLIEAIGKNSATEWFKAYGAPRAFQTQMHHPHYIHTDVSCIEAARTSVTVDILQGLRISICPRHDCGKPFTVRHEGKLFCSQYCAHFESVRRARGVPNAVPKRKKRPRRPNRNSPRTRV